MHVSRCPGRGSSVNGEATTGGQAGWVESLFGTWLEEMGQIGVTYMGNH